MLVRGGAVSGDGGPGAGRALPLRDMCRRVSGAPFLGFVHFPIDDFEWIQGRPTRYRSSAEAERGFPGKMNARRTPAEAWSDWTDR